MSSTHPQPSNVEEARLQQPHGGEVSAPKDPTKKVKFKNRSRKGKGRSGPPSGTEAKTATTTSKSLRSYPEGKTVFQATTAVPAFGDKTLATQINVLGYRQAVRQFYTEVLLPAFPNFPITPPCTNGFIGIISF